MNGQEVAGFVGWDERVGVLVYVHVQGKAVIGLREGVKRRRGDALGLVVDGAYVIQVGRGFPRLGTGVVNNRSKNGLPERVAQVHHVQLPAPGLKCPKAKLVLGL